MGLQRGASQDSIPAARKLSGDSNVTTPTTATERSNPFDFMTRSPAKTPGQIQPIAESPRPDTGNKDAARPVEEPQGATLGSPLQVVREPKKPEVNGAEKEAISPSAATPPQVATPNGTGREKEQQKPAEEEVSKPAEQEASKPAEKEASKPATRTPKHTPKPLTGISASKPTTKQEPSPRLARGPRTPVAATHHAAAKKTPEKKAQPSEKPATPRATATAKPAGPSSIKKPPPLQASPASTGFVKPKVKSPTRPVKLPSSLTTHTASSGSKVSVPRESLSRTSNNTLPADPHGRPASRASGSTAGSASNKAAPTRGLRRQNSTINRPRPSLGPPPKQAAKDHPPTKREKEVDQGFLARMMRPTASSAQKTTSRVQTSPPRKLAAAPKKAATAKPVKKVAAKPTVAASSSAHAQSSTAKQIAAETAHATTADEVVETAKAAEGEVALPAEAGQKSSAQEVAPIAELRETAEEVSAAAKEAGDEAALPQVSEEPANGTSVDVAAESPAADGHDDKAEVVSEATSGPAVNTEDAVAEEKKDDAPETTA